MFDDSFYMARRRLYRMARTRVMSIKHLFQRFTRGFGDDELWSLDSTLAKWLLPRLKHFRNVDVGHPNGFPSMEAWQAELDKIILALEYISEDCTDYEHSEQIDIGLDAFRKHFRSLWI